MHLFKLVNRRAVPCDSVLEWGSWFASADRQVADTWIGDVRISTVFLGIDQNPFPQGDPALFETLVFVADSTSHMNRYFIWEEAEAGHAEMVALIRAEMDAAQAQAVHAWMAVSKRVLGGA